MVPRIRQTIGKPARAAATRSPIAARCDRRRSLLLDDNLDLRSAVAQTNITVLPLLRLFATCEQGSYENQQASELSFHPFPLHESHAFCVQSRRESRLDRGPDL